MKNIFRAAAVAIFLAGIAAPIKADQAKPSSTPTAKILKHRKHHRLKKTEKGKPTPVSKK